MVYIEMDDLGVPLFLETPIYTCIGSIPSPFRRVAGEGTPIPKDEIIMVVHGPLKAGSPYYMKYINNIYIYIHTYA